MPCESDSNTWNHASGSSCSAAYKLHAWIIFQGCCMERVRCWEPGCFRRLFVTCAAGMMREFVTNQIEHSYPAHLSLSVPCLLAFLLAWNICQTMWTYCPTCLVESGGFFWDRISLCNLLWPASPSSLTSAPKVLEQQTPRVSAWLILYSFEENKNEKVLNYVFLDVGI